MEDLFDEWKESLQQIELLECENKKLKAMLKVAIQKLDYMNKAICNLEQYYCGDEWFEYFEDNIEEDEEKCIEVTLDDFVTNLPKTSIYKDVKTTSTNGNHIHIDINPRKGRKI